MTTTFAQRSNSFALIWTDFKGTKVSPSDLNPGFTLVSGSSRFSMSEVVVFEAISSSSDDDIVSSSREIAVVGSRRTFSLEIVGKKGTSFKSPEAGTWGLEGGVGIGRGERGDWKGGWGMLYSPAIICNDKNSSNCFVTGQKNTASYSRKFTKRETHTLTFNGSRTQNKLLQKI